jgi:AcrR family transcriptional regulator
MHSKLRKAPNSKIDAPLPTRQRLLDAAHRVCARKGLHAATTREIADEAHVNEVTLFRHFGSREKLIAALFQQSVAAQSEALGDSEPDSENLKRDLLRYAHRFDAMLFSHEALIRTIIGEARRYPEQARQVISDSARPMRERLIVYLEAARKAGAVRKNLVLSPAVDAFTGMLLAGMLRRTGFALQFDYDHDDYVTGCVDLFLRAIEAPASKAKPQPRRKSRRAA